MYVCPDGSSVRPRADIFGLQGWNRDTDFDQIAGALVAGHLIECSSYVCGGYYSGFKDLFDGCENLGFPIAEIHYDGTCVIEKEPGTGGEVSLQKLFVEVD